MMARPSLAVSAERLEARPAQRLRPVLAAAVHERLPLPHEHEAEVRQRRQVPGRAHRAAARHHR